MHAGEFNARATQPITAPDNPLGGAMCLEAMGALAASPAEQQ